MDGEAMRLKRRHPVRRAILTIFGIVVLIIGIIIACFFSCHEIGYVAEGHCMYPLFCDPRDYDYEFTDFYFINTRVEPQRGDVIIFYMDYDGDGIGEYRASKRLIALGGDRVDIEGNTVYLNGEILDEPYVLPEQNTKDGEGCEYAHLVVPEGYFFAMGDNRDNSADCRETGPQRMEDMIGVVTDRCLETKDALTSMCRFFVKTVPSWFGWDWRYGANGEHDFAYVRI